MHEIFSQNFIAGSSESDCYERLRPSALQHFIQEVATGHVDRLGIGRDALLATHGAIWVFMRLAVTLDRPIKYMQQVRVDTWCAPTSAATFNREFEFFADGEAVGHASSLWVIADFENRKIVRPSLLRGSYAALFDTPPARFAPPEKLDMPPQWNDSHVHRVSYTDLDLNMHVHNSRYTDLACDAAELERERDRFVREYQINFTAECRAGDHILFQTVRDGDTQRVRGIGADDRAVKFDSRIVTGEVNG